MPVVPEPQNGSRDHAARAAAGQDAPFGDRGRHDPDDAAHDGLFDQPELAADLAVAAGFKSASGVRTAYGHHDVDAVAAATGAKPREWRAADPGEGEVPA